MPSVPSFTINQGEMFQHVSLKRYSGTPLYFGKSGTNRYDDPAKNYGVLYLGFDLSTALMESVFHKHKWHRTKSRPISKSKIDLQIIRTVGVTDDLHLADLTAPDVMAAHFGLNLTQLIHRGYLHTQRVSAILHAVVDAKGFPIYDGILYPSRNNYPKKCVALFEDATSKVSLVDDIDLATHTEWPDFKNTFNIVVRPN
jgi:hypothetical protein